MTAQAETTLMEEISRVYSELSPENLSCDGEVSRAVARRRYRQLRGRLERLFLAVGRRVSEDEAWTWVRANTEESMPDGGTT